eukprot:TRINITY_DN4696_c0_g2_i1.p1 TRINITY_DN4696_c0_g2~~TRINITY_DN4696_c0_g2_i1.p1  ORF type:complete len:382 (-),score=76.77 TRINITY_DN4696_c0_g2_i1:254-1324(-)
MLASGNALRVQLRRSYESLDSSEEDDRGGGAVAARLNADGPPPLPPSPSPAPRSGSGISSAASSSAQVASLRRPTAAYVGDGCSLAIGANLDARKSNSQIASSVSLLRDDLRLMTKLKRFVEADVEAKDEDARARAEAVNREEEAAAAAEERRRAGIERQFATAPPANTGEEEHVSKDGNYDALDVEVDDDAESKTLEPPLTDEELRRIGLRLEPKLKVGRGLACLRNVRIESRRLSKASSGFYSERRRVAGTADTSVCPRRATRGRLRRALLMLREGRRMELVEEETACSQREAADTAELLEEEKRWHGEAVRDGAVTSSNSDRRRLRRRYQCSEVAATPRLSPAPLSLLQLVPK